MKDFAARQSRYLHEYSPEDLCIVYTEMCTRLLPCIASHAEIKYYCLIDAWFWGFTYSFSHEILYFSSKYFFSLYKQYIGSYKLYIILWVLVFKHLR